MAELLLGKHFETRDKDWFNPQVSGKEWESGDVVDHQNDNK